MKTHKFRNGLYHVEFVHKLDGACDLPPGNKNVDERLWMTLPDNDGFHGFHVALHEALHADDCPIAYVDKDNDGTLNVARFLWRWLKMNGHIRKGGKK